MWSYTNSGHSDVRGMELPNQGQKLWTSDPHTRSDAFSDVTIAIQATFRGCAQRALSSIQRFIPSAQFIVACEELPHDILLGPNVKWVQSPEDAGLAQGRNILLDNIETDFVVFLDEDFMFNEDPSDGILYLLKTMEDRHFDLIGGCLVDYACSGYTFAKQPYKLEITRDPNYMEPNVFETRAADMVDNFFIARSLPLRRIMWDEFLKIGEHEDFFLRAYHTLRIGISGALFAHHNNSCRPLTSKATYDVARSRVFSFWKFVFQKWKLTTLTTPTTTYQLLCDVGDPRFAENLDDCHIDFPTEMNPWGSVPAVPDPFPRFYSHAPPSNATENSKIGIVTVATGKYQKYIEIFLKSMRAFFLPGMN